MSVLRLDERRSVNAFVHHTCWSWRTYHLVQFTVFNLRTQVSNFYDLLNPSGLRRTALWWSQIQLRVFSKPKKGKNMVRPSLCTSHLCLVHCTVSAAIQHRRGYLLYSEVHVGHGRHINCAHELSFIYISVHCPVQLKDICTVLEEAP